MTASLAADQFWSSRLRQIYLALVHCSRRLRKINLRLMKILVKPPYFFKGPGLSRQSSQLQKTPATELNVGGLHSKCLPRETPTSTLCFLKIRLLVKWMNSHVKFPPRISNDEPRNKRVNIAMTWLSWLQENRKRWFHLEEINKRLLWSLAYLFETKQIL